jgi:hypothetical protein
MKAMKDGYELEYGLDCIKLTCPLCGYNMSGNINMHFRTHLIRAVTTIRANGFTYLLCACGHKCDPIDNAMGIKWDESWNEMYKHWVDGGDEHMAIVLLAQEDK